MKICWFGIYDPDFSRNRIYMKGLRENGVEIVECRDDSSGPVKFLKLFLKHRKIRGAYDYLVVGYPGHVTVWLAKLISNKPVIFDALCTMEEGVLISRRQYSAFSPKALYIKFIDWLAVKCADLVLVETEAQRKFFVEKFGRSDKYKVIYIGADDSIFYPDPEIKKKEKFTVVFRGKFLPEAGVGHIIEAAKLLENQDIKFLLMGNGWMEGEIKSKIENLKLRNLELISRNLPFGELRVKMQEGHVSLGQFEDHERLSRTIPHKCFESVAMGLTYVTARTASVSEILKDGESVVFVNPADPEDLAKKIVMLKNNPELRNKIAQTGRKIYETRLTPKILASEILQILQDK